MKFYLRIKNSKKAHKKDAEIKRLLVKAKNATETKAL